ncbi:hypothetical protein [Marivivens donghaensis]|uniref:hypothetical protein n=1 Tax=Marivivens donghaensis TaxID=1699413 RepID=UPI00201E83B8|nr:hypothetical protein [Marivivens donghaensis]MCL7408440.1 hypothetical protein [Marivivens donghaensis]MDN3704789.1 hypothetical protein [Marivivens donghaensis]
MSKQNLLPRSNAAKKAVRAIMRKISTEPNSPDIARLTELYDRTTDRETRRLLRAVRMQILTAEPTKPAKFIPKKLPKPEPVIEEPIEKIEVAEEAPPAKVKPKKASSMMSLDLSDATMLLQFGGNDAAEEEEDQYEADSGDTDDISLDGAVDAPTDEQVLDEVVSALAEDESDALDKSNFTSLAPATPNTFSASELVFPSDDGDTSQSDVDWDPFAEADETERSDTTEVEEAEVVEPQPEAPKPVKAKKGVPTTDLSALSGGSALFDQLGGSFGDDMDD